MAVNRFLRKSDLYVNQNSLLNWSADIFAVFAFVPFRPFSGNNTRKR